MKSNKMRHSGRLTLGRRNLFHSLFLTCKAYPECPPRLTVPEDLQKNSILLKCFAVSGEQRERPISYKLSNGGHQGRNGKQIFREFEEKDPKSGLSWVVVRNMESLDYEQTRNYSLTLTATVRSKKRFLSIEYN